MAQKQRKKWSRQDWTDLILVLICIPVLVIGFAVTLSVYQTKQKGNVPTIMGYCFFTVQTGSMEPELMVGESFVCKTAKASQVKQGDIISFYNGRRVVTHKVYEVVTKDNNGQADYTFLTYGVNNTDSRGNIILDDFVVTEKQLIGIYKGRSKINPLIGFMTGKWGLFCLVILPLGVLIVTDILTLISYIKPKPATATADGDPNSVAHTDGDSPAPSDKPETTQTPQHNNRQPITLKRKSKK